MNAVDLGILVVLTVYRGWPVVAFALAGFALSFAYTAPPLRFKKRGLGEPDVFLVWGPLMVCGTYYAAVGHIPGRSWPPRSPTACCARPYSWASTSTRRPSTRPSVSRPCPFFG